MMKIYYDNNDIFMFINNGYGFGAIISGDKVIHISAFKKMKEPDFKGWTLRSKKGAELSDKFVKAALNYESKWTVDDLPVEIMQSGAGYYAGCFSYGEYGGPYCRLSGYCDTQAEAAAWIWKNDPTRERE